MKVLVTGGSGVVGNGLIPELLRSEHSIRLLSRHASKDAKEYPAEVTSFDGDVRDPGKLRGPRMLEEENTIDEGKENALVALFDASPAPLQHELEVLADSLPEQPLGEGIAAMERQTYAAEIKRLAL